MGVGLRQRRVDRAGRPGRARTSGAPHWTRSGASEGRVAMSAMRAAVSLIPVDSADVTILDDNYCDLLLAGSEIAQRPPIRWDSFTSASLRAEHGYALLLTVWRDGASASLLSDAGLGPDTGRYTMAWPGLSTADLRAAPLSHRHDDYT